MEEELKEIVAKITAAGENVRLLKTQKAAKELIDVAVNDLLAFKEEYKTKNNGTPYDPPKVEAPKKEKGSAVTPSTKEGPSKKELNKLARKEGKKAGSEGVPKEEGGEVKSVKPDIAIPPPPKIQSVSLSLDKEAPNTLYYCESSKQSASLDISRIVLSLLKVQISCVASNKSLDHLPYLTSSTAPLSSIAGDCTIARYLAKIYDSGGIISAKDEWVISEINQWLDIYVSIGSDATTATSIPSILDSHLATRTYIVGQQISLADVAMYVLCKRLAFKTSPTHVHMSRWFSLIQSIVPPIAPLKVNKSKVEKKGDVKEETEEESCPALVDAVEGKVCTRFPPEPSGYLHIGHCKAVLLNQYYAQRYKGKLLVRFDDTNPSKEKEEFEDNIIKDLETLGVVANKVSHSSDHFSKCEELARKMIKDGNAYMDDTDQAKMQAERMERVESSRRNTSVEDNLKIFESLLKGEADAQKYCLRAKIDMSSVNGTMRDPVLYRFNDTPHHRTGTKHKAYPTYDFACPIIDSIEGVTHALRTTEYNDRDEQYAWIQRALSLRTVHIQAFGKMNFVHTVLSKRKLNWFVENNLVEGWFDPRFPTVQGCIRRGMNVDALKSFIISQGASRRIITMEWDKFWSENKKILEERSPRYMGVDEKDLVVFTITNVPAEIVSTSVQIHPQKPENGTRVMRRFNKLFIDQLDALTFSEGEEVTFIRWGNFFIEKIEKNSEGKVISMSGRYHPDATNFSKTKKTTWLAAIPDVVPLKIFEFDHLISKAKLEEDDKFENFINPDSKKEYTALGDPCLRTVQEGDVIQLERKGFFRCDVAYNGKKDSSVVLFYIPDGKIIKGKVAAAPASKKK